MTTQWLVKKQSLSAGGHFSKFERERERERGGRGRGGGTEGEGERERESLDKSCVFQSPLYHQIMPGNITKFDYDVICYFFARKYYQSLLL